MRNLLFSWITGAALLTASSGILQAQPAPPVQPPMGAAKAPEAAKLQETPRSDGPSPVVCYTLAGIGAIVVMVLVCMPARRE